MYLPKAGGEPRGHFIPRPAEPIGHFVPKGNPEVRAWARAASEHAEVYVRNVLDPKVNDLRQFIIGRAGGGRVTDEALAEVQRLHDLIRTLPAEMAYQVSQADSLEGVEIQAPVDAEISRLMNYYPWMAPRLVPLRHAMSKQALEDNVAIPAGRQIGFG